MLRVTVKKDRREAGYRGFQHPGADIKINQEKVGHISHSLGGWIFHVHEEKFALAYFNSAPVTYFPTYDEAKKAALAHVKQHARETKEFRVKVPFTGVMELKVYGSDENDAFAKASIRARQYVSRLPPINGAVWTVGAPKLDEEKTDG